ncbi:MAG: PIN domain-containing protein [Gemmataceae bacterium]|nr:PIN domain-containing protein [Gemmataceae bacterium]
MIAIDTNVLVYSMDADEPSKRERALGLLDRLVREGERPILLWQVACELLSQLRNWEKRGKLVPGSVEEIFARFTRVFPVVKPGDGVFGFSFRLREEYSLSHWDSLILAACLESQIREIYSEDFSSGATYRGVRVINPFQD